MIAELRAFDPGLEIVVVSDGSTDRTAEVAEEHGAHALRLPFNLGIGGAVQTGFRYAYENGFDLAVRVDGDGQHDAVAARPRARAGARRRGRHRGRLALRRRRAATARRARAGSASASSPGRSRRSSASASPTRPRASRRSTAAGSRSSPRDYPHDYPEVEATVMVFRHRAAARRGAGDDARARARPLVDHRAALDLLHGQGAARARRRRLPPQRVPRRSA